MSKFSLCRFAIHHRSLGEKNSITGLFYRYLDYCTDIMSSIRHDRKVIFFLHCADVTQYRYTWYILSK